MSTKETITPSEYEIITLDEQNIADEHICCGFSDKKCREGYEAKKELIKSRFADGFTFKKFNIRGKVFIEYVPAEHAFCPVDAPGYMFIHCFWVSGKYKGHGFAKALLAECIKDAEGMKGIVAVTSKKNMPFLTDKKFFTGQGFTVCDTCGPYELVVLKNDHDAAEPAFLPNAKTLTREGEKGLTILYSNLCVFTENWVDNMLGFAAKFNISARKIKINTKEEARSLNAPIGIVNVYYDGTFVSHELMLEKKFDKVIGALVK